MSARIPHLLTHLLSSDDLDAVIILDRHREQSFERRSKATPSVRRKSLGLRYTR